MKNNAVQQLVRYVSGLCRHVMSCGSISNHAELSIPWHSRSGKPDGGFAREQETDGTPHFAARVRSVCGDQVHFGKLRVGRDALLALGRREARHRTKDPIRLTGRLRLQRLWAPVVAVLMAVSACTSSWSEQDVAALLEANESALQKLVEEFAQEPRIHAVFAVRGRYDIRGVEPRPGPGSPGVPGSLGMEVQRGPGSKWTVTKESWTSNPLPSGGTGYSRAANTFEIVETFEEASGYKGATAERLQRWMSEIDALGIQGLVKGGDVPCPGVVSIPVANYTYLKYDPCQTTTEQAREIVAHLRGPWYYHRLLRGDPF